MASPLLRLFALAATAVSISLPLIPTALSQQTCKSQRFSGNNVYANCLDLPALSSFLHFTFDSANSTLSVAFLASPPASGGWVSWAINPSAPRMAGAQALVAYKDSKGVFAVKTYNISSYTSASVVQSKLNFEVWDARAEEQGSGGVVRIFAKLKLPADMAAKGTVNHVWQVGPSVDGKGVLAPHAMGTANLNARGALDFKGGQSVAVAGGGNSGLKKKNIHGVLNAVSWGILLPVGAIIARYVRSFPSADPAWFYLHVGCQVSGYAIGVSGWATGLKLGSESKGIQFTGHRNIGIALFAIATLQMFALFLRPGKEHKLRIYWNVYHHGAGYAILVLGILNVFKGLDMLQPESKWRKGYVVVIAALGGIAVLLEVITWSVVLRRKSKQSTKPYDHGGYGNNVQRSRQQQPLNA